MDPAPQPFPAPPLAGLVLRKPSSPSSLDMKGASTLLARPKGAAIEVEYAQPVWRADVLCLGESRLVVQAAESAKQALRLKGDLGLPAPLSHGLAAYGAGAWLPTMFAIEQSRLHAQLSKLTQQHPGVVLAALVRANPAHPHYRATEAAQLWVLGLAGSASIHAVLSIEEVCGFMQTGKPTIACWTLLWRAALVRDDLMGRALTASRLDAHWKPIAADAIQPASSTGYVNLESQVEEPLALARTRR